MDDLMNVVDWSRWQFALTAMYHWLFVPLTLGLSIIVGLMETIYYKTKDAKWLAITKFWMLLFGINFACGVATGIILEFEFGTNWSNYSWFVGDIFGAPLAIEGILAFFMESTFIAVMFFGWKKVSPRFHLASTWLTAIGACLSALWILVANAWMQYPVGTEFDPAQMRNVMSDFWAVVASPMAINKFFHTVLSGWVLGGVFVVGVSCWFLLKKRNIELAQKSIKIGGWVGLVGIVLTMWTGDGSAVAVSKYQPMKLAAMEGLYDGKCGQEIVAFGILNPQKTYDNNQDPYLFDVSLPYGLSILAKHDPNAFVPGINDLIKGIELTPEGDTIHTDSYAQRIEIGRLAHAALREYGEAEKNGDSVAMADASARLAQNFKYFGYGYFNDPSEAVPPVALTFYAFHIMVIAGGYLLMFFVVILFLVYKKSSVLNKKIVQWLGILTIPVVWICSQSGWVTAEVGRQPWIIQDLMPTRAAISNISASSVQITFWMFVVLFTGLLVAEICIMLKVINKRSKEELDNENI